MLPAPANPLQPSSGLGDAPTPADLVATLDHHLGALEQVEGAEKQIHQAALFEAVDALLVDEEGLRGVYARAPRLDAAGVFMGGPWADVSQLQVPLVSGTLRGPGVTPVVETLSELRMLAIAKGQASSAEMTAEEASRFLDEVMARNLRYLFPADGATEDDRLGGDPNRASHERLFALIAEEHGLRRVLDEVAAEVEQVLAQRPISTWSVRRTILRAKDLAERDEMEGPAAMALRRYAEAIEGPTPLSREHPRIRDYRSAVKEVDTDLLAEEAEAFAASMLDTGLVARHHAVLVRHLVKAHPALLAPALGLDDAGTVELAQNEELVHRLIAAAAFATTAQCLYGLRQALERTLVSRSEVTAGLERLLDLELLEDVKDNLLAHRSDDDEVTAEAVLLAGTIAVLGQPLGIGQGKNPTCQSARGMSLWAQHDPAHLLELIVAAARDGRVEVPYDGKMIRSDTLPSGVAAQIDLDLDPASIVLVPHLDRLYSELMRRSVLRMEDAHKWVNPALYGHWVPNELASAFVDLGQTTVQGFETFVRRFFSTHHPAFNGGYRLMYPNPVGLVITNHLGKYLGPHAVSIQRVDEDPEGVMRVYFYNPNNEGRQDWGHGVTPTVSGRGEEPGESSLPFDDFTARLYAFHYNPQEDGDGAGVPDARVHGVIEAARATWGSRFMWLDPSPVA